MAMTANTALLSPGTTGVDVEMMIPRCPCRNEGGVILPLHKWLCIFISLLERHEQELCTRKDWVILRGGGGAVHRNDDMVETEMLTEWR